MHNDVYLLQHGLSSYIRLNIESYKLNTLCYISLPGISFDWFLKISGVISDSIQDEQLLNDFIDAIRGGMCVVMGNSFVKGNSSSSSSSSSYSSLKNPYNTWTLTIYTVIP